LICSGWLAKYPFRAWVCIAIENSRVVSSSVGTAPKVWGMAVAIIAAAAAAAAFVALSLIAPGVCCGAYA
jgi:hypothetical protein